MDKEVLRELVQWSRGYKREWDDEPGAYADAGLVQWAKSRRLGLFRLGAVKAYIGVQHVDPALPGWNVVDEPSARFFLSILINGRTVTLRTFASIGAALDTLGTFLMG